MGWCSRNAKSPLVSEPRRFSGLPRLTEVTAFQLYQLLRQGGLIAIAILLAKSSLTTEDIGAYEMLLYVGYAATFFWTTGLVQGLLSLFPKLKAEKQAALLLQGYLVIAGATAAVILLLGLGADRLLPLLTGQPRLPYFRLFLLYLLLHQPTFLLEHYFLLRHRARAIVLLGLLSTILQIGVVIVALWGGYGLAGIFVGLILFAAFRHLWLLAFLVAAGRPTARSGALRRWILLSLPLMGYALLGGLHQVYDNWLVGFFYQGDEQQFALFRYGARELPLALALTGAFGTALLPAVAKSLPGGLAAIRKKSRPLYHLLFPFSIVLMLTSDWWFPLLFSEAFAPSVLVFNVFLLLVINRLIFPRTVLMGLQDNGVLLWISLGELVANALLSFWLVRSLGLAGIALGTVLAYSLGKTAMCWYLYRRHGIGVARYTDIRLLGGYSVLLLIAFFVAL